MGATAVSERLKDVHRFIKSRKSAFGRNFQIMEENPQIGWPLSVPK
jgi:hypothetical protein